MSNIRRSANQNLVAYVVYNNSLELENIKVVKDSTTGKIVYEFVVDGNINKDLEEYRISAKNQDFLYVDLFSYNHISKQLKKMVREYLK